jgi:hypothetical protein
MSDLRKVIESAGVEWRIRSDLAGLGEVILAALAAPGDREALTRWLIEVGVLPGDIRERFQMASVAGDLWNELENCRSYWELRSNASLIQEYIDQYEKAAGCYCPPNPDVPLPSWQERVEALVWELVDMGALVKHSLVGEPQTYRVATVEDAQDDPPAEAGKPAPTPDGVRDLMAELEASVAAAKEARRQRKAATDG